MIKGGETILINFDKKFEIKYSNVSKKYFNLEEIKQIYLLSISHDGVLVGEKLETCYGLILGAIEGKYQLSENEIKLIVERLENDKEFFYSIGIDDVLFFDKIISYVKSL